MHDSLRRKILKLLDQHRLMTLATNRPDGWPQATVGYVKDGLTLYFLCSLKSQKAASLARDSRVRRSTTMSRTRWRSPAFPRQPRRTVTDPTEVAKAMKLLLAPLTEKLPWDIENTIFAEPCCAVALVDSELELVLHIKCERSD